MIDLLVCVCVIVSAPFFKEKPWISNNMRNHMEYLTLHDYLFYKIHSSY